MVVSLNETDSLLALGMRKKTVQDYSGIFGIADTDMTWTGIRGHGRGLDIFSNRGHRRGHGHENF